MKDYKFTCLKCNYKISIYGASVTLGGFSAHTVFIYLSIYIDYATHSNSLIQIINIYLSIIKVCEEKWENNVEIFNSVSSENLFV